MNNSFFNPFIGREYKKGICGKRVFVLGASFYCNHTTESEKPCPLFEECTNPQKKDSSKFDSICPFYKVSGQKLSEEPSNAIAENYPPYRNFAVFMQQFIEDKNDDVWQKMAFTDYVQFFVPTIDTKFTYMSERDFKAFNEVVKELRPDVIVVWGEVINKIVRDANPWVYDKDKLPETEHYVCHIRMPGLNHDITMVCCYHPSPINKRYWDKDLDKLSKYMDIVLRG